MLSTCPSYHLSLNIPRSVGPLERRVGHHTGHAHKRRTLGGTNDDGPCDTSRKPANDLRSQGVNAWSSRKPRKWPRSPDEFGISFLPSPWEIKTRLRLPKRTTERKAGVNDKRFLWHHFSSLSEDHFPQEMNTDATQIWEERRRKRHPSLLHRFISETKTNKSFLQRYSESLPHDWEMSYLLLLSSFLGKAASQPLPQPSLPLIDLNAPWEREKLWKMWHKADLHILKRTSR